MSLTLLAWRRTVAALYADVRATADHDPEGALRRFRAGRDRLFREHPDSPLDPAVRAAHTGLSYWPHDPALRFEVEVEVEVQADAEGPTPGGAGVGPAGSTSAAPLAALSITGESFRLLRIGRVTLPFGRLEVYWLDAYGGGVFLPFRDGTSGAETYGAGRYLLDTVKGADLGGTDGRLVLDFNYAYHPSCAYDPRWSCPLAPPANTLPVPIRAGERLRSE